MALSKQVVHPMFANGIVNATYTTVNYIQRIFLYRLISEACSY